MTQSAMHKGSRASQRDDRDGILLIDKNEGETSFDVVRRLKKTLKTKKIGHAGTLDPFATGLLIILLGQGTKLSPFLMSGEKRYRATICLGVETDTQDPEGHIIRTRPVPELKPGVIKEVALRFTGEIEQIPPTFSAVSYRGKRAYKLARKGIKVELKKRKVKIRSLRIISVDLPEVTMDITCSGGTYIRSLAADIGKALRTGAHLSALRRLSSGPFEVKDALDSKKIGFKPRDGLWLDNIIHLRDALPDMKEAKVQGQTAKKIRNGCKPEWWEFATGAALPHHYEGYIKLVTGNTLVAVMDVNHLPGFNEGWLKKIRVFN